MMDALQRVRLESLLMDLDPSHLAELHGLLEHVCGDDPIAKAFDALETIRVEVSHRERMRKVRAEPVSGAHDTPVPKNNPRS